MYSFIKKLLYLSLLHFFLTSICLGVPFDSLSGSSSLTEGSKELKTMAAKNALDIGLLNLSEYLYSELLKEEEDPVLRQNIGIQLASVLINENKNKEAWEILSELREQESPETQLLKAISLASLDQSRSKKILEKINPKELKAEFLPWLYIAKGAIAQENQNSKDAKKAFLEAREVTKSRNLKTHIDSLLFYVEIFSGVPSEALEKRLLKKIEKDKTADALKQYAIVLDQLGKKKEAIEILESSLESQSFKGKNEADSIILLIALTAGTETEKGRYYLEKIIERKQNIDLSKTALSILAEQTNLTNAESYFIFLTKLIDNPQQHSLIDTLLIQRAQLALVVGQNEVAQTDASRIIEEYPGSNYNSEAMKILAYAAWTSIPPRYRTAAGILTQLSESTKDNHERVELNRLAADSYFLNQDYTNAAQLYTSLLQDPTYSLLKGDLVYQLTLCAINQNNITLAKEILDKYRQNSSVDSINIWKAEWNILNWMKKHGQFKAAFTRIHELLYRNSSISISNDLMAKLLWMEAELSFESGNAGKTPPIVDSLFTLLKSSEMEPKQVALIASHALLLKAQAFLKLKKEKNALEIIEELRERYPHTKAAILSYIVEARYYASINNSTKAQQQLINLSDNYPNSEYATISLYEAALNAESRGLKKTYQEALAILERLSSAYSESPIAYDARFKQGDILRKLGDFSNAQLIYENIIKQYPENPKKTQCELAFIDCMLAQTLNNNIALSDIVARYTQIFESRQASNNLRAEAGFKAGFTLLKGEQVEHARATFWLTVTNLLVNNFNYPLNEQSRYWIARSIFELGNIFEKAGTSKEANEMYHLILTYNLPGAELANSKIKN